MALYSYKGIDKTGKEIRATINSDSENQAKQKLRSSGIMLISIKEQKAEAAKSKSTISFGRTVSIADLALMTRQLATLIRANIQIVEALNALIDQADNQQLKVVLSEIKQKVNEGSSLAGALADYPKIFNNVYVNMVEAGETSGTLAVVLLRLAEFTENQVKLKSKIRGAMTYPVVMMVIGSLMIGIIFTVAIPKITKIFVTMKRAIPVQTRICIWISNFLQSYWWVLILGAFIGYYLFKKYINSPSGRKKWHATLLRLPIVANLIIMINISRFCSTLGTLLASGVPILTSMKIVINLISNIHMAKAVEAAKVSVAEGRSLAIPLEKSGLFPSMVTHMIKLGERSGEIEPMLQIIAENYEDQVDAKLSGLTSILEPIMLVVMGIVVAFIVISVIVPMMELNQLR